MQHYKTRYHPMIILLYHSKMLSPEQVKCIPRTTRNNWNKFSHENYFGYDIAKDYIEDFDYMKDVLTNKHLKRGMKTMCAMSYGYKDIIANIEGNKKLLRKHREDITFSIERMAKHGHLKIKDACKLFGVSRDWFYRHREQKSCSKSLLSKCFHQYPNQLTNNEVSKIENIVTNPNNFGKTKTTLYFDSIRKGIIVCGLSTFFKYADLTGYKKPKKKVKNSRPEGFRANKPFEWLHVDVTHVQTQNEGVQYVAFIKDNYSKALLGYKSVSHKPNSGFIRDLFVETFEKYNLLSQSESINILSDGGSENKGTFTEWLNLIQAPPVVRKLTARTEEFPHSNSMAESTHSIYKTEFMQEKYSVDVIQHLIHLEAFIKYYNDNRFPFEFFGFTPIEILNGEIPNKAMFREQISERRQLRITENRAFNECSLVCV